MSKYIINKLKPRMIGYTSPILNLMSNTLKDIQNKKYIPRTSSKMFSIKPLAMLNKTENADISANIFEIKGHSPRKTVVGIDATCEVRGENLDGFLIAVRGTSVEKTGSLYKHERIGPIIVSISKDSISSWRHFVSAPWKMWKLSHINVEYAKQLAMQIVERSMILNTMQKYKDSLILIDGSLNSSRNGIELNDYSLKNMIQNTRDNNNQVIGISKSTKLFKICPQYLNNLFDMDSPAAIEIDNIHDYLPNTSCRVYFGILSKNGEPLRIDIPNHLDEQSVLDSLISNDIVQSGYPETLKRSHIYSKFSQIEKIAIDWKIRQAGATWIHSEGTRDVLFGHFNHDFGGLN